MQQLVQHLDDSKELASVVDSIDDVMHITKHALYLVVFKIPQF